MIEQNPFELAVDEAFENIFDGMIVGGTKEMRRRVSFVLQRERSHTHAIIRELESTVADLKVKQSMRKASQKKRAR